MCLLGKEEKEVFFCTFPIAQSSFAPYNPLVAIDSSALPLGVLSSVQPCIPPKEMVLPPVCTGSFSEGRVKYGASPLLCHALHLTILCPLLSPTRNFANLVA